MFIKQRPGIEVIPVAINLVAPAQVRTTVDPDQPAAREPGSNTPPIGPDALLTAMPRYLNDRAASIYGGSNEIQRDIMARLVLGL